MSINRRRRARRARMIRNAGATGKRPIKKERAPVPADATREYRKSAALFQETQGKARPGKPQKSKLWAKHSVDLAPYIYGRRNNERGRSSAWGGHWLRMRTWERGSFIRGKGLSRSLARIALYVQGKPVGWTDDMQFALGWTRAAEGTGLDAHMIEAVGHEMLEGMS